MNKRQEEALQEEFKKAIDACPPELQNNTQALEVLWAWCRFGAEWGLFHRVKSSEYNH